MSKKRNYIAIVILCIVAVVLSIIITVQQYEKHIVGTTLNRKSIIERYDYYTYKLNDSDVQMLIDTIQSYEGLKLYQYELGNDIYML